MRCSAKEANRIVFVICRRKTIVYFKETFPCKTKEKTMFNTTKKKILPILAVVLYIAGFALLGACSVKIDIKASYKIIEDGAGLTTVCHVISLILIAVWLYSCNNKLAAYQIPFVVSAISLIAGSIFITRYTVFNQAADVLRVHSAGTAPDWYFDYSSSQISGMQSQASAFAEKASAFMALTVICILIGLVALAFAVKKASEAESEEN